METCFVSEISAQCRDLKEIIVQLINTVCQDLTVKIKNARNQWQRKENSVLKTAIVLETCFVSEISAQCRDLKENFVQLMNTVCRDLYAETNSAWSHSEKKENSVQKISDVLMDCSVYVIFAQCQDPKEIFVQLTNTVCQDLNAETDNAWSH